MFDSCIALLPVLGHSTQALMWCWRQCYSYRLARHYNSELSLPWISLYHWLCMCAWVCVWWMGESGWLWSTGWGVMTRLSGYRPGHTGPWMANEHCSKYVTNLSETCIQTCLKKYLMTVNQLIIGYSESAISLSMFVAEWWVHKRGEHGYPSLSSPAAAASFLLITF